MTVRRAASHIATIIVAVCIALAVPVSQLRLHYVTMTCCCPDPASCHCPHEKPDHSTCPTMKACHKTQHETVVPQAPSFAQRDEVAITTQPRATFVAFAAPVVPQPAPSPDEPYGPS